MGRVSELAHFPESLDGLEDGGSGLFGREEGGIDGEAGEAAVEGVAGVEAALSGLGISEVGAVGVAGGRSCAGIECLEHAAVEEGAEGGVEEDGEGAGGLLEEEAVGEGLGCAAAEGEDDVGLPEGAGEGGGLEAAEVRLAVLLEEVGDGGAGAGFEVGVEVEEGPAELGGEKGPTVDLPAPMKPVSTMRRRPEGRPGAVKGCWVASLA